MLDFKQITRVLFYKLGYEILKRPIPLEPGYEIISSRYSTYAPWSTDDEFLKYYEVVYPYTMVDKYRCYELWKITSQMSKLEGNVIEIGAWKGGTSGLICKRLSLDRSNKTVYVADTFKGVAKASELDKDYEGGEHSNTSVEIVTELLKDKLNLLNFRILEGIFPEESSHLVPDDSFCFCHVDVDVYNSARDIEKWIWPKLVKGGIMIYDDYGFIRTSGVTKFVNEEREKKDRFIFHNLNGQAIVYKF